MLLFDIEDFVGAVKDKHPILWQSKMQLVIEGDCLKTAGMWYAVRHRIATISLSRAKALLNALPHKKLENYLWLCTRATDAEISAANLASRAIPSQSEREKRQWSIFYNETMHILIALSPLQLPSLVCERIIRFLHGVPFRLVTFAHVYALCERIRTYRHNMVTDSVVSTNAKF